MSGVVRDEEDNAGEDKTQTKCESEIMEERCVDEGVGTFVEWLSLRRRGDPFKKQGKSEHIGCRDEVTSRGMG